MTEATAPLVSVEVDLRDFAFMPLDVLRIRDSGLAAKGTGDEFRAALLLWCASWHQVPAASLPDDDEMQLDCVVLRGPDGSDAADIVDYEPIDEAMVKREIAAALPTPALESILPHLTLGSIGANVVRDELDARLDFQRGAAA